MKKPSILLTLLVRDEIDTIRSTIDYHRAVGVENFVVTDNGSIDGTAEYLRKLADRDEIRLIEEPQLTYSQGEWVTRMAHIAAADFDVDWIIHCDADEYFWSGADKHDLRDYFASVPEEVDVLRISRVNMLADPIKNESHYLLDNVLCDVPTIKKLGPKVCHRPSRNAKVAVGNHHVSGLSGEILQQPDGLTIYHYPYRSYEIYEQKIINGAEALNRNSALAENIGAHWRKAYERYKSGELRRDFERNTPSMMVREQGIAAGRFKIVEDVSSFVEARGIAEKASLDT